MILKIEDVAEQTNISGEYLRHILKMKSARALANI